MVKLIFAAAISAYVLLSSNVAYSQPPSHPPKESTPNESDPDGTIYIRYLDCTGYGDYCVTPQYDVRQSKMEVILSQLNAKSITIKYRVPSGYELLIRTKGAHVSAKKRRGHGRIHDIGVDAAKDWLRCSWVTKSGVFGDTGRVQGYCYARARKK